MHIPSIIHEHLRGQGWTYTGFTRYALGERGKRGKRGERHTWLMVNPPRHTTPAIILEINGDHITVMSYMKNVKDAFVTTHVIGDVGFDAWFEVMLMGLDNEFLED